MDGASWVSVFGAVLGFAGAVIAAYMAWKRGERKQESSDVSQFRTDLLEFTATLQNEINGLRDRVHAMEGHNIEQNKTIIKLELRIAVIARALIGKHGITIEQLLGETA